MYVAWCGLVIGCTKNEFVPPPPPEVTVAPPVERTISRTQHFTGTTVPFETVEIRARVKGFLDEVKFTDGADVEEGDLLAVIDPRPFQAALSQAQASHKLAEAQLASANAEVLRAQANATNAENQLVRGERARQGGAITESQLDDMRADRDTANAAVSVAQAAVASANAEIAAANAAVEQARLDLGYTQVTAPIAGRVGRVMVDQGNLVGADEPTLITTIIDYDPIYAYFTVSEVDFLDYTERTREETGVTGPPRPQESDLPVFLGLANEQGYPHPGRFDYADLAVDKSSGTYLIRAVFPNPDRVIPPGAFVRVEVQVREETVMLVDEQAIGRDQAGPYVLVVNSKNEVERRNVVLGELYEGQRVVEVESRLKATDRIVVNGLLRARPGAIVNPQPMSQSETKPTLPSEEQ